MYRCAQVGLLWVERLDNKYMYQNDDIATVIPLIIDAAVMVTPTAGISHASDIGIIILTINCDGSPFDMAWIILLQGTLSVMA